MSCEGLLKNNPCSYNFFCRQHEFMNQIYRVPTNKFTLNIKNRQSKNIHQQRHRVSSRCTDVFIWINSDFHIKVHRLDPESSQVNGFFDKCFFKWFLLKTINKRSPKVQLLEQWSNVLTVVTTSHAAASCIIHNYSHQGNRSAFQHEAGIVLNMLILGKSCRLLQDRYRIRSCC